MSEHTILIVDDEERIRRLLKMYLEKEGFCIDEADNGEEALNKSLENNYSLILLDVMLPGIEGMEVLARLREYKSTPVLMLTAKGEEINRVEGFELGADDYVAKPFSPRELIHRVKAILRRSSTTAYLSKDANSKDRLVYPNLLIEHSAHRVTAGNQEVSLTPKEYELLYFLAVSPDKVFSREELLKSVWKYDYFGDLRTVDTHIKRLREKLNKVSPESAAMITTVWGVGYKFLSL